VDYFRLARHPGMIRSDAKSAFLLHACMVTS
jgi:hypothetical protein